MENATDSLYAQVGLMGTQVDQPAGFEDLVCDDRHTGVAEGSITDDIFDVEGGVAGGKLDELGGKWMWGSVIGQFVLAWLMALIIFQGGLLLGVG